MLPPMLMRYEAVRNVLKLVAFALAGYLAVTSSLALAMDAILYASVSAFNCGVDWNLRIDLGS